MKQFVLSMLPKRIASVGIVFRGPFEDALEIHQLTEAKHLHRFSGVAFKRWTFGLLHCVPDDAQANRNGNHHITPSENL